MNKTFKSFTYAIVLTVLPFFLINLKNCNLILTIPVAFIIFYSILNYRYPLYFIPSILFYNYFNSNILPLLFFTIGLTIILKIYILNKPLYLFLYTPLLTTLVNLSYLLLTDSYDLKVLLINSILSIFCIAFLSLFLTSYKLKNKYIFKIININGILFFSFILTNISSLYLEKVLNTLEIQFLILCVPILVFNILKNKNSAIIFTLFAILLSIYRLNQPMEIVLLFLLVEVFTLYKSSSFILTLGLLLNLNTFTIYEKKLSIYLIVFLSVFELIRILVYKLPFFIKSDKTLETSSNINNNFCDQVIKFSSFLDDFSRNFIVQVEEKSRVNEAFNNLINSYCFKCQNKYICFSKDKNETYIFLKNCLMHGQNLHYKKNSSDIKEFFKKCKYTDEIIIKAHALKNKYNIFNSNNPFENTLVSQISGISNTLRQYVLDIKTKQEIDVNSFVSLKNELLNLNYIIILFNIKKNYMDDFLLEIGIDNIDTQEIIPILSILTFKSIHQDVSIEIKENKDKTSVTYFSIFPKKIFNVNYGYGQIAKDNLNVKGDNYLIKKLENGALFASLSDGMGHGINAYQESKMTINMIDKIIDFDINTNTSINILNTFYSLKDNFDNYATLDLLEIHQNKSSATLYKMGSTCTYVVKNKKIVTYVNTNLPFGINDLIMIENIEIENEDLIVLMSDGITDNIDENTLKDFLILNRFKEPQKLVYDILQLIEKTNNKIINDDMSIIILKIEDIK